MSALLCTALVLPLTPTVTYSASSPTSFIFDVSEGNIKISTGTTSGTLKVAYGPAPTITADFANTQEITITGTTTSNSVTVESGVTTNIILDNVKIDKSTPGGCAFDMTGATVNLTLANGNTLTGGGINAGLLVPSGAVLTIGGTGTLTATGGADGGAGIGGAENGGPGGTGGAGGSIKIRGGTITSTGGTGGAGIGGGRGYNNPGGAGGSIEISGGTIVAIGDRGGAGIGGGDGPGGDGGSIKISGGTVTATGGGDSGAGIGGSSVGDGGSIEIGGGTITATGGAAGIYGDGGAGIGGGRGRGGNIAISGGSVSARGGIGGSGHSGGKSINGTLTNGLMPPENVCLTTVTIEDAVSPVASTLVSSLTTNTSYIYGANDMKTDTDGKLYLYLPENTRTTAAKTTALRYTGKVTTTADPVTSSGTLSPDTVVPAVSSVTPSGTCSPQNGNVAITFDEEMSAGSGTVALSENGTDYTPLTVGSWSAGNTAYMSDYSGLKYNTQYTVKVEGFQDFNGNTMLPDTGHTFTTLSNSDASLSGLSISQGALSPAFAGGTYAYTAWAANSVYALTVTPTTNDINATVTVNGTTVTSGTASPDIPLSAGNNTITIIATAQNGNTQTYTVTVTRVQHVTSGGGGSNSNSRSTPATPTYKATVSGIKVSKTTLPVGVNTNTGMQR